MPFEALGLDPKIAKAVREAGYTEPTPIQTKAIPLVLRGRDVIGIIIATPGRLIDLMDQGHVDFSGLEVAVLDEADRMLDMGFLPAMRRIVKALPKRRQTMMFSATLSKEIETLTNEFLIDA